MTKITCYKIFEKLQLLDEYFSYLEKLKKEIKSEKDFLKDFHFFGLAERYLQLSCQIIIDILNLIIIEEGLEKPEDNQEIISILFNKKILSENLASQLEGIAGFRNILVHEYGKINREIVFNALKKKTQDFLLFKKEILKWLKLRSNL